MNEISLQRGKVYRVTHLRKGTFVARLIEVIPAPDGDEMDTQFLHMIFDVRAGTDQVGLGIVPGKSQYRESNLRPSLITKISEVPEGEDWLREIQLPEPEEPEEKTLLQRINPFSK